MSYSAYTLLFANNAGSTLAGPITNTATSLNLASGGGALFPNPSAGQAFVVTAVDAATGLLREVMLCTARSTDTLTIVRAQESTTALNWLAGDLIQQLGTAGQMADFLQLNSSQTLLDAGTFGGSANALTATIAGAPATLTAGIFVVGEYAYNNTGATTFNLNGLGTIACYRDDNIPFSGGEAVTSGLGLFFYDGNYWILLSQLPVSFLQGLSGIAAWTAAGTYTWTVPANVYRVKKAIVTGPGGGGAGCSGTASAGSCGGAGGTAIDSFAVHPGDTHTIVVGAGGAGGASGAHSGSPGAASSTALGLSGAPGQGGGQATAGSAAGGGGGVGSGATTLNLQGGAGSDGESGATYIFGGNGGGSYWGGGGRAFASGSSPSAPAPGGGGGGAYNFAGGGQNGADGAVSLEW